MSKGWHNEPGRHALAAKGVATKFHKKGFETEIEDEIRSFLSKYGDIARVSFHEYEDGFRTQFHIKGKTDDAPDSVISYDVADNSLRATLRFPVIKAKHVDDFDSYVETFGTTNTLIYTRYTHATEENVVVPHIEVQQDHATPSNITTVLQEIDERIQEGLSYYD